MKGWATNILNKYLKPNSLVFSLFIAVILVITLPLPAEAAAYSCDAAKWYDLTSWSKAINPGTWLCVLGRALLELAGAFTFICGNILDLVTKHFVFEMRDTLMQEGIFQLGKDNVPVVTKLWVMVRDLANLGFIFILIYAALTTIFKADNKNVKRIIPTLVLAAIIMNFSLFFTQVAIDFSNYLSYQFFTNIKVEIIEEGPGGEPIATMANIGATQQQGLSSVFMNATKVTKLIGNPGQTDNAIQPGFVFGIFAALFTFIAGLVMLAGAVLLFVRFFMLLIYMIASPIAIASIILQRSKRAFFENWWLKGLIGQLAFAPAYFALLYLSLQFLQVLTSDGLNTTGEAGLFSYWVQTAFVFGISTAFLIYAFIAAKQIGSFAGKGMNTAFQKVGTFASKHTLGRGMGAAGFVGRRTVGKAGMMMTDSKTLRRMAGSENNLIARTVGRKAIIAGENTSKKTFDLRDGRKDYGTAHKGGYDSDIKEKAKAKQKFKKMSMETMSDAEIAKLKAKEKAYETKLAEQKNIQEAIKIIETDPDISRSLRTSTSLIKSNKDKLKGLDERGKIEGLSDEEKEKIKKERVAANKIIAEEKQKVAQLNKAKDILGRASEDKTQAQVIAAQDLKEVHADRKKLGHELRSEFWYVDNAATKQNGNALTNTAKLFGAGVSTFAKTVDKFRGLFREQAGEENRTYNAFLTGLGKIREWQSKTPINSLTQDQHKVVEQISSDNEELRKVLKNLTSMNKSERTDEQNAKILRVQQQIRDNIELMNEQFEGSYTAKKVIEDMKKEASKSDSDRMLEALKGINENIKQSGSSITSKLGDIEEDVERAPRETASEAEFHEEVEGGYKFERS